MKAQILKKYIGDCKEQSILSTPAGFFVVTTTFGIDYIHSRIHNGAGHEVVEIKGGMDEALEKLGVTEIQDLAG